MPADGVLVRVQAISIEGGDTLHRARDEVTATPHVVGSPNAAMSGLLSVRRSRAAIWTYVGHGMGAPRKAAAAVDFRQPRGDFR